jgi:hypothetical protein
MGEFRTNPNLNIRIFLAKQKNRAPFVSDTLYGDSLLKTQGNNFRTNIVIGKRDGIPQDQPIDYFYNVIFKQIHMYVECIHIHQICLWMLYQVFTIPIQWLVEVVMKFS